jgi:hypothetical protein
VSARRKPLPGTGEGRRAGPFEDAIQNQLRSALGNHFELFGGRGCRRWPLQSFRLPGLRGIRGREVVHTRRLGVQQRDKRVLTGVSRCLGLGKKTYIPEYCNPGQLGEYWGTTLLSRQATGAAEGDRLRAGAPAHAIYCRSVRKQQLEPTRNAYHNQGI